MAYTYTKGSEFAPALEPAVRDYDHMPRGVDGQGIPAWPAFSEAKPLVMYFAQTPHPGPVPGAEALQALDAYFAWRRTPDGITAVK